MSVLAAIMQMQALSLQIDPFVLPFPVLDIPDYREWAHGPWKLRKSMNHPPYVEGYFRGRQPFEGANWVLTRKDGDEDEHVWMSLAPMERESLAPQLLAAHGSVLVMGCGMGVLLFNLMRKKRVKTVIVVERDQSIIDMVREHAEMQQWEGRQKVTYICEDALSFSVGAYFDVALIDIWPGIGDSAIRPDMQRIARNVHAVEYSGWSQELDFVSWGMEKGHRPDDLTNHLMWAAYSRDIGVPLILRGRKWMSRLALRAAEVTALGVSNL